MLRRPGSAPALRVAASAPVRAVPVREGVNAEVPVRAEGEAVRAGDGLREG